MLQIEQRGKLVGSYRLVGIIGMSALTGIQALRPTSASIYSLESIAFPGLRIGATFLVRLRVVDGNRRAIGNRATGILQAVQTTPNALNPKGDLESKALGLEEENISIKVIPGPPTLPHFTTFVE